jgi:hypothetical protein
MPFQSEKQRRYLWANEPEIARDWTDTYGSRVRKQSGGIMETILMQLAKTYGMNKAMEMLGMGKDSDQSGDPNLSKGYFGNLMSNFNPTKALTRFGLNKAFSGLTGGSGMSGFGGALLPLAGIAGLAYMLNKNRLGLTGYTTQRGYEQARQDRINMNRQSNIIKTLQSGKYAPGWEKTAFDRVQKLGKNLNLVDAADVGLTGRSKSNPKPAYTSPARPHGNGGNRAAGTGTTQTGHGKSGMGRDPSDRMARGGLAGLWPR